MRRSSTRCLLLLTALIAALPPHATRAQQVTADTPRFKEAVDLVVLTVTVQQGDGAYVDALDRGDFRIFEEGMPQSIQRQVIRQQSETAYQMRALATDTGGRTFPLTTVHELAGAYESIATELSHQYCVAYMPAAPRPRGQLTHVAVVVDRPNVKVRTRTGYVGSGPPATRTSQ